MCGQHIWQQKLFKQGRFGKTKNNRRLRRSGWQPGCKLRGYTPPLLHYQPEKQFLNCGAVTTKAELFVCFGIFTLPQDRNNKAVLTFYQGKKARHGMLKVSQAFISGRTRRVIMLLIAALAFTVMSLLVFARCYEWQHSFNPAVVLQQKTPPATSTPNSSAATASA